jgi:hypothetical protein
MKYLNLYENYKPEIANEWAMRRAVARDLLTLPQVYSSYIKDDRYPSFRELMYRIWKNLTHEDQSKLDKLEKLGLFKPEDIEIDQLMQLPGMEDIMQVFDNTKVGRTQLEPVNYLFPGLVFVENSYSLNPSLNWGMIERMRIMENGETNITIGKGYISDIEGPNGEIPILVLNDYYVEAWVNIKDLG